MGRKRKTGIELPANVHAVKARGKTYYYYQPGRNTPLAGTRVRIPHDPQTPDFWSFVAQLSNAKEKIQEPEYSVRNLIKAYQASQAYKALADSSKRDYDRYLALLEQRLGKFDTRLVTLQVMVTLQDSLADRPSTANHAMSVYKTLFKWGLPRSFGTVNPCDGLEKVKHKAKRAKPWPDDILQLALDHCRWEIRAFVMLGLYTGQRTSDILRMRLNDIENGEIRVIQQKTGKDLWIPIHSNLKPIIAECRKRGSMVLIPRHDGSELDANGFRAMFTREMGKDQTKRLRDEGYSPHGLRASAASRLKEVGCSNGQISSITGMSSAMVERYTSQYNQQKTARAAIALWEKSEK